MEAIPEAGSALLKEGVLGVLLFIALCAVAWLGRRLLAQEQIWADRLAASQEARISDQAKLAAIVERANATNASVAVAMEARSGAVADMARTLELKTGLADAEFEKLRESIEGLHRLMLERFPFTGRRA